MPINPPLTRKINTQHFLHKLLKTSPQEIYFRGRRLARAKADRVTPAYAGLRFLEGLASNIKKSNYKIYWDQKKNFYFSRHDRTRLLDIFRSRFSDYLPGVIHAAEKICQHNLSIFGKTFTYDKTVNWHQDPLTLKEWPQVHWSQISVVDDSYPMDAKWVWEINRHQFLIPVGIAYWATQKEKFARYIMRILLSWIDQNPPGIGINWVESLEVSTRITTWLWLLELLRESVFLTPQTLTTILDSLVQQAAHVYRYTSFYISPNTHLTGEGLGLFMFGCLYP